MKKRLLAALVAVLLIGSSASAMAPAARRAAVLAGRSAGAYSARRVGAVAAPIFRSRAAAVMAPAGTRGISIDDFLEKGGISIVKDELERMEAEKAELQKKEILLEAENRRIAAEKDLEDFTLLNGAIKYTVAEYELEEARLALARREGITGADLDRSVVDKLYIQEAELLKKLDELRVPEGFDSDELYYRYNGPDEGN